MSGAAITVGVVVIICICVVAIYFVQAREKAKVERIRKVNALSDRHQKLQRLLHELPPQYVSNDLRLLILQKSMETLNTLLDLKKSRRFAEELAADEAMMEQIKNKQFQAKSVVVKDETQARAVRSLLEILYKFVQQQAKLKTIDPGRASQYLEAITFGAAKSKADLLVSKAENAEKAGKPRVAIHAYHTALEALKNQSNHPVAAEMMSKFRQEIKRLEVDADKHNQEVKAKAKAKIEGNDEWSEFTKNDDEWKKKNAYDD